MSGPGPQNPHNHQNSIMRREAGAILSAIPAWFPNVLLPALPPERAPAANALIAAPALAGFWQAMADHVPAMIGRGWDRYTAAATLVGAVLVPVAMGYDARNTLSLRVRRGVDMAMRNDAAKLARNLVAILKKIEGEPLPPDAVLSLASLLPDSLISPAAPSYFLNERTADLLLRLAAGLELPPDYAEAPGLASQQASWRGFIREAQANLASADFKLREVHAVALAAALCNEAGIMAPSRDSVRSALRGSG